MAIITSLYSALTYEVERKIIASSFPKKPTALLVDLSKADCAHSTIEKFPSSSLKETVKGSLFLGVSNIEVLVRSYDHLLLFLEDIIAVTPNLKRVQARFVLKEPLELTAFDVAKWSDIQKRLGGRITFSIIHDQREASSLEQTLIRFTTVTRYASRTQALIGKSTAIEFCVRPDNVWQLEEILEIALRENVRVIFRILDAREIRGCNDNPDSVLTREQAHNFALFLVKILRVYEKDVHLRLYYEHLLSTLSNEYQRIPGCLFQSRALVLYENGDLAFCPLYSKRIIVVDGGSPVQILSANLSERQRITREHCPICRYYSEAPTTTRQLLLNYADKFWRNSLTLDHAMRLFRFLKKIS